MSSRLSLRSLVYVFFLFFSFSFGFAFAQDEPMEQEDTMEESMDEAEVPSAEPSTEMVTAVSARYLCELQGLTRRVEIDYESAGSSVPCSVNYYKDTEAPGEVNTLWNATNIEGYCEQKAAGFIDKLKSWGWSCMEG